MKNRNNLCLLVLSIIFIACDDTNEPASITVTPPLTYAFERDGQSTVSYSGQSTRLEMAGELSVWLNTAFKTKEDLSNMFDNGTGFGNPALAMSGKKLGISSSA